MWSAAVQATPENARRRLYAAIDALDAADVIITRMPENTGLAETRNARAWASRAVVRLGGSTDARRRVH